jgi:single-stranded-DNA-specific exonuclease
LTFSQSPIEYTFELESATVSTPPIAVEGARDAVRRYGSKRWRLRSSAVRGSLQHSGLPKLIALALENRGIGSNSEAQSFLGGRDSRFRDAAGLPGFEKAMALFGGALSSGRLVSIYGDFDVDGIASTAILTEALQDMGGHVLPYIPNREREGYGLNLKAIDSLADCGVDLLVTCDCGTTSVEEVKHARALGIEVIVVDHHVPPAELPDAGALINPKLPDARYSFIDYSTAGIAFRLAGALYESNGRPFPEARYAELAALGTVADMVPLVDENRELVRRGLTALRKSERPGLRALIEVAGYKPKDVTAEAIAFGLAPPINAAGRLADAKLALELLLTAEEDTALSLAEQIDALNRERQRMTLEAQALARELVESRPEAPLLLVGHTGFHQGIIGLVASRLVELFGRPAVVYQQGELESRGSCRSISDYDITTGLRACGDLFQRYGGHRQAGGFTILNQRLPELNERLVEHAGWALDGIDLTPVLNIDAEWPLNALRSEEIRWMGRLEPHGQGNPDVTLLSRDVTVTESRKVGQEGQHLRLKLRHGAVVWPAIAFGWEGDVPSEGSRVDVVYSLSADRYGSSENGGALQLAIVDLATPA